MKILFSEAKPDYGHYLFPYVIWAFPEPGEEPGHFFEKGFLPSSGQLTRFYLCRQVRVNLRQFRVSSENRRILRKGVGITSTLLRREEFEYTRERRQFYKNYADIKFGKDVMTYQRLDSLFRSKITSHILLFHDNQTEMEVGAVTLYIEPGRMAYYYYAFYDLAYYQRNLGIYMMTAAVNFFAGQDLSYLYLGSCYSRNAFYKTQFAGAEFFNGFVWSRNLKELKYLIERDQSPIEQHLLESEEFQEKFYPQTDFSGLAPFQIKL